MTGPLIEADPQQPVLLVTDWGGGYALAADVETETAKGQ